MNRKLLAVVVSGALVVPMAAQAVDFSVSGHIARAITVTDNDGDNDVSNVDSGASGSRFRMKGSSDLENGITASVNLEYGAGAKGKDSPTLRHANIALGGEFGKLTIGQQSPATDGVPYSNFDNYAFLGGVEISCDYCSADFAASHGGSRNQGVRYDTPAIGPATVGIWSDANDMWDIALRASGDAGVGGYQFKAGYGDDANGTERIIFSGAVGLAMGGHFGVAWGKTNADDSDYLNVGVGYNAGDSSVAANYYTSDISGGGSALSFGVGHSLGSGVEVFASYMYLSYDDDMNDDVAMENEGLFVIGSRMAFN